MSMNATYSFSALPYSVPRDMQVLYKLSHEKVTGDYMCIQKSVFEET